MVCIEGYAGGKRVHCIVGSPRVVSALIHPRMHNVATVVTGNSISGPVTAKIQAILAQVS